MVQYYLTWDGRIMFPKKQVYYVGERNKNGDIVGKIKEFPNIAPMGFEFGVLYDAKEHKELVI